MMLFWEKKSKVNVRYKVRGFDGMGKRVKKNKTVLLDRDENRFPGKWTRNASLRSTPTPTTSSFSAAAPPSTTDKRCG
jgi:hypothetical protein